MHESRLAVLEARRGTSNGREILAAQVALLSALERFEDALTAAGATPPHHIRHEVDLLRNVVGG